ncbi:MAG: hypothetical protein ACXAC7_18270, partial [Candidatus Hodarchaeales archaeon]
MFDDSSIVIEVYNQGEDFFGEDYPYIWFGFALFFGSFGFFFLLLLDKYLIPVVFIIIIFL